MKKHFVLFAAIYLTSPSSAIAQTASPFGPNIEEYGSAVPIRPKTWFTVDDYPAHVMMRGEQGRVVSAFEISTKGRITNCNVEISSGNKALDAVPCKILLRRARFKPALGADGLPVIVRGRVSTDFWLPSNL